MAPKKKPTKSRKSIALYAIWYIDPAFNSDDRHVEPCPILICGFPVKAEDDYVTIAGEAHADGLHRDFTTIPKAVIKEMKKIRVMPIPQWVQDWRIRAESPKESVY